ncbi:MAG: CAP domain-containing protein, partial [Prosthecobacter sp.]|nr:CAP domain-containing protein [Prosthecobacter sp.]
MLLILLTITTAAWSQGTTLYSIGEPTDEEQLYLEMINRARANPTAEGVRMATTTDPDVVNALQFHGVDLVLMQSEFAAIQAGQPLALNAKLTTMARGHNADMFTHAFQGHESFNGDHLAERVAAVNYSFSSLGENVFSYADSVFQGHAGFQVDWGSVEGEPPDTDGMQEGRGHRTNIHGDYREVGIGVILGTNTVGSNTVGPQLVTQNFGTPSASSAFVTGVAYYDLNGNNFYDLGEGIGGLTVNVAGSSFHAVTANSGGFTVPIPTSSTTRAVTFAGLGLNGGGDVVISGGKNVKVDFKPAFTPLALNGPTVVNNGGTSSFSFPAIGGATSYEWQALKIGDVPDDGAENFDRVTATTTETYAPLSTTVKHSGAAAYHLVHPIGAYSSEILTYDDSFQVQPGASLSFRSRLRAASTFEYALVQVSVDDGINWVDVYSQAGVTPSGQSALP